MGTNFYTLSGRHIGKRSAAGYYCWDCGVTLCKGGEKYIHYDSGWYDKCPICGKSPDPETLDESSVGRELGFNKLPFNRKTGVKTVSSFTWAIRPDEINKYKYVKDEYGNRFTINEFKKMLLECPIQYYDLIGKIFC